MSKPADRRHGIMLPGVRDDETSSQEKQQFTGQFLNTIVKVKSSGVVLSTIAERSV